MCGRGVSNTTLKPTTFGWGSLRSIPTYTGGKGLVVLVQHMRRVNQRGAVPRRTSSLSYVRV
jgi:hypothetical protein